MKILHLIAGAKQGGAEHHMMENVLALAEAGFSQHVVTRNQAPYRLKRFKEAGVPLTLTPFSKLWRSPTEAAVRAAIAAFKPDVVHHWMGRAGIFAQPDWQARNLAWHGGYYKLERFKHCAWHAAVTSDIERTLVANGAPKERAVTLHNYASLEPDAPLDRAQFNTPSDAPLVLTLARLHWKKGIDTLLHALTEMPGVYAWIAGEGPLEGNLKAMAGHLGVADRVRWLGWRTDRAALLAACDAVALPSRYEPFGNVTIEAWAAGKPLVACDAAGPVATITPDVDALMVPRENPAALSQALRRVLENPQLAARLVEAGRRSYDPAYTKAAFVDAASDLYARIDRAAR